MKNHRKIVACLLIAAAAAFLTACAAGPPPQEIADALALALNRTGQAVVKTA